MTRKIIFLLTGMAAAMSAGAQNRYEENMDCDVRSEKIIVHATVKGTPHQFLLDVTRPTSAVLKEAAEKLGIEETGVLEKVGIGQNLFLPKLTVRVIDAGDLKDLGVTGVLGVDALKGQVLTINKRDLVLTISAPYKPAWIPLRSRAVMISGERQTVSIAGKTVTEPLDALLDKGVLTLDFARTNTFFETYEAFAGIEKPQPVEKAPVEEGLITHLNRKAFLRDVFDFRQYDVWNYQGDMPCVIDFWATWCIPCRRLAPIIKELSEQYEGRVKFYKINVDEEKEISAGYFDIGAIPVLVFVPMNGEPVKTLGVDSKSDIEEKIERVLLRD